MKSYFLPLILFLLLLSYSWAQPHGGPTPSPQEEEQGETESSYTPIDDSQITSNPQLQGLVSIGVQDVTQQAIQDGSLPEGNYQVSQIVSAAQNQDDYCFEVEVTDDQGNTVDIIFFISYNSSTGTTEITSYDVLGNEGGETTDEVDEDGFVVLDPSIADTNPIIRGIIILGVQEATTQAIADGSLDDSHYQFADVYSIEQGVENSDEYKFDVSVVNDLQNTVRMDFDLLYDSESNSVQVLSFGFPQTTIPNGEETEVQETFEEETPEASGEQTEDKFVVLDPSVAQTDTEIVGILNVGVKEAIKQAIANGSLYDSAYELAQVYSVQQNLANPDEYRFNVSVSNSSQITVIIYFDLIYNESTNTVNVISWRNPNVIIPPVEEEEENSTGAVNGIPAGFKEVYFDPNDSSSRLYELGELGLQEMVTQGVYNDMIPDTSYFVTDIISVSEYIEGSWLYYRFDMYAADEYGNSARFTYIVSYDTATSKKYLEDGQISNVVSVW